MSTAKMQSQACKSFPVGPRRGEKEKNQSNIGHRSTRMDEYLQTRGKQDA